MRAEAVLGAWTEILVNAAMSWSVDVEEEAARWTVGAKKESMDGALEVLKVNFVGA